MSDIKGCKFLELLDEDSKPIELYTSKGSLLQTQDLRVSQANKPCIGLIQENSMENSIQDCLSYITSSFQNLLYSFL